MPYVMIHMGEGKTLDQKRAVARDITEVLCKDLDLPFKEGIQIEFTEFPATNLARGGVLGIDMNYQLSEKSK
jgi:4-oxalocrotonate tautomerase